MMNNSGAAVFIDIDKWLEIFSTLGRHKLRTFLTAFGIFWGFFLLIALLGVSKGLENGVIEGVPITKNYISLWSQDETRIAYPGYPLVRQIVLTSKDVDGINNTVVGVDRAWSINALGAVTASYKGRHGEFKVDGTYPELILMNSTQIIDGRFFNKSDIVERRKVVIIGSSVSKTLFGENAALDEVIDIDGTGFKVVGVFDSYQASNSRTESEKIYIPNETLRYEFSKFDFITKVDILPTYGTSAQEVERRVREYLCRTKGVDINDVTVFGSFNMQTEYEKFLGLFHGIKVFCWIIAIATVLTGVIGVSNIMMIITKERTREIGIRRTLGATPFAIISMVVQESVLITLVAGYLGIFTGFYILDVINSIIESIGDKSMFFRHPKVDLIVVFEALVVLVLSGTLASVLPAANAAKISPVEALRQE